MVNFHLSTTKETDFLYTTTTEEEVIRVIEDCVAIHNAIIKIREIVSKLKDLIKLGPMGENNERANPPEKKEILERAIADAEAAIDPELVKKKVALTVEGVTEELARLSGAVTIVYPEGLPKTDPVRKIMDGEPVKYELDPKLVQFWVTRKSYQRGKHIFDYTGKNERQTFVAKFTGPESGPPPRDMTMDKEAQIRLMSQMHRKAEELKRIENDDDTSYLDSQWANPRGLKNTFQGLEDVDWKPK
ncbi:hypothetical protein TVAG_417040 [Trichomonas vaginalis G3]|uniref:Uncharacterized protein n=1 Tax=Trichomonas vaginalis (strain ATCC PRA-98 / G3) TaxID=412133 RepID=A2ESG2_TRIV3|nr:regulation of cilium movement [Trichomonas vaginalis G3]EAY04406.1 hypothetical protein TVAG_417040 [Trichomonas vaginalis G3]KAI5526337.1 regulation of cilium movement [Trichomonas vaginalis G3]|eukprot:XP_001316629.1 hypothetical protein [Trichomonas vaginalis G3]